MAAPYGIILMVLSLLNMVWGIACAVIGGIVRFNLVQYVNEYISDLDVKNYMSKSDDMIAMKESYDEADLGSGARAIGILALVVGILTIVYALVGLAAGMLKNSNLLFVLIGTMLVCTMLQFVTLWMVLDVDSSFHDTAKDNLVRKLRDDYKLGKEASTWSQLMNSIMLAGQCCGIKGPGDFPNMTWTYDSGKTEYLEISPACCKPVLWDGGVDTLVECGARKDHRIFKDGCYNVVFDDASDAKMYTYALCIMIFAGWECVCMMIAVLMLFHPPEDEGAKGSGREKGGAGADAKGADAAAPEAELKVFTPFSKISSYQDATDINRIKSTEIW